MNGSVFCERYINDEKYMIEKVEDGIWPGTGMYF